LRSAKSELPGIETSARRTARSRPPYPAEFRTRIIAVARAGRSPEDLDKDFEPCSHTIRSWLAAAGQAGTPGGPAEQATHAGGA